MDIEKKKEDILNIIFRYLPKEEIIVFLFGSFAKREVFNSSDIDIGILSNIPISDRDISAIRTQLNEKITTLRDIEVVDFTDIKDKDFLSSALREIEIWWKNPRLLSYLNNLRGL